MRLCLGTTCLLRAVMKTLERAIIGEVHPCCQYPERKPFKSLAEASRPCQMQRSDRKKSKNASGSSRSAAHRPRCHLGRTDVLVNMEEIRRIIFFLQLHQAPVVHSIGAANALFSFGLAQIIYVDSCAEAGPHGLPEFARPAQPILRLRLGRPLTQHEEAVAGAAVGKAVASAATRCTAPCMNSNTTAQAGEGLRLTKCTMASSAASSISRMKLDFPVMLLLRRCPPVQHFLYLG